MNETTRRTAHHGGGVALALGAMIAAPTVAACSPDPIFDGLLTARLTAPLEPSGSMRVTLLVPAATATFVQRGSVGIEAAAGSAYSSIAVVPFDPALSGLSRESVSGSPGISYSLEEPLRRCRAGTAELCYVELEVFVTPVDERPVELRISSTLAFGENVRLLPEWRSELLVDRIDPVAGTATR